MYPWRKPELFKPLIKSLNRFHIWIYEKYDGRFIGQYNGLPFCLMKVKGRKTGNLITIALLTIPHGDDYILVDSQGGAKTNPLWYYNLKENPEIEMQVFSDTFKMRAIELYCSHFECVRENLHLNFWILFEIVIPKWISLCPAL